MKPIDSEPLTYGQESRGVLVAIFALSTLLGAGLGYGLAPDSLPLWRMVLGGGVLGFHAAMYPYANRYLMM